MRLWATANQKPVGQAGISGKRLEIQARFLCCLREIKFFLRKPQLCSYGGPLTGLHSTLWRVICFTEQSTDLNVNHILKTPSTVISRLMFNQTTEHHSLAKLTHKINDHSDLTNFLAIIIVISLNNINMAISTVFVTSLFF